MQQNDLNFFREWFSDYVKDFSSTDPLISNNIEMKIEHTVNVCENVLLLAKSEHVSEEGCRLAETIALFHDVGRFEQFIRYKTFKDSDSENHALLGVNILNRSGILTNLSQSERSLILKAIEYHNLKEIPGHTSEAKGHTGEAKELLFYSKLIRDADKLDILRLLNENYETGGKVRNPALDIYLPDTAGCSKPIFMDILNNRMAEMKDVKNLNDIKLLRLSWIFDIYFPVTFSILKKQRYLDTIISSIHDAEEIHIIEHHLEEYLKTF